MASREEIGSLVVSASLDAQQFQNGVSSLKRELAVAKSEFTAASATLGSFGSDLDKLKLREEALGEQMKIQQRIVDALSASYEQSATTKGEDAKQTQNLAIKLNQAKAGLAGMTDELKRVQIGLEEFESGEVAAEEEERRFSESMMEAKEGIEGTHAALLGMVALMGAGMLSEMTEGAEKMAINLQTLQDETGNSSDSLERLAVVASGAGVGMDQLGQMVGRMDKSIQTAQTPTKAFMDALGQLGISTEEFTKAPVAEQAQMIQEAMDKSKLPTKTLDSTLKALGITAKDLGKNASQNLGVIRASLEQTADTGSTLARQFAAAGLNFQAFASADTEGKIQMLGKYMEETKDKSQATALVMSIFGKSGQQMLPLIQNFSELDDYAKQLKMPVMDTSEIQLAAEKTKMLQTAMQMLVDSMMAKLLPIVDNVGKAFYQLYTNLNHPIEAVKEFEKDLGPVATAIMGVVTALTAMKVINSLVGIVSAFKESILAAGDALKSMAIFTGIMSGEEEALTIKTVAQTVAQTAQTAATKAAEIAQIAFNAVMDANPIAMVILAIAGLIAGIILLVRNWQKVITWLKEAWNWFKHLGTGVQEAIAIIMPFIGIPALIVAHWSSISSFFKNVAGNIRTEFTNLIHDAESWGENLIHMFVSGITNTIHEVESAVKNVASKVASFLGFHSPTEDGPASDSDTWAPNFVKMFAGGLLEGIPTVQSALSKVLVPPINPGTMFGVGQMAMQSTAGAINNGGHTFNVNVYGGASGDIRGQILGVFQNEIIPQITQASRAMGV